MTEPSISEIERFASKYVEDGDCWRWQGPLDKDGYGHFYFRRRGRRAHRFAWFLYRGPIPEGMVVNHVCKRRDCVNPQHLELLTPRENALQDSLSPASVNARKTHCKQGHAYDRTYGGQRSCSRCQAEKTRRLRAKWRGEDTVAC
jgi:hypothetical protein